MTLGLFPSRKHGIGSFYGRVLAELFSKLIYGILVTNYGLRLYVYHGDLPTTVRCLQQHHTVQLQSLLDIVVIDSPQSVSGRFGLLYTFGNYNRSLRFFVKTFTSGEVPIHSISQLFPSAGGLEREAWDLFGVQFLNHDDLRRILTDYGFRGHPLRKDFPLMGFLEIRYDDSQRCLVFEPVELTQEFRFFRFEMPWSLGPAN